MGYTPRVPAYDWPLRYNDNRITSLPMPHAHNSKSPDLTIGLPVYNGERHLSLALDSVLSQSYPDFRLIISDNASTDATEEICLDYASRDARIEYQRQDTNMGGAWNFNAVVALADSPYFKWISHDDITGAGFLESCMEQFSQAPGEVILSYPRTILIDDGGETICEFNDDLDLRQERPHHRLRAFLDNYKMSNPIFGIIRTDLLKRTSLIGSYVSSDKVLMAEMALLGQFWEVPDRLFLRRYHEGMSRKANVTAEEVAQWFDPNHPRPVSATRTKLYLEYTKAIHSGNLGLSSRDRLLATRELAASGGLRELRVIAGEMKREVRIRLSRAASRFRG